MTQWVEAELGGRVVSASPQQNGFSSGSADRILADNGRRAFVKTVSRSRNEQTLQLHRREAEVMRMLPTEVRAPALLDLPGCGALGAAKIVGEVAGISRFADEAKFAMHAGVAPIPVWSGSTRGRVRLNRAGNRQLNAALHRIALTQIQRDGAGRAYYDKRLAAGDSKTEALRCLKRRLARVVFNTLTRQPSTAAVTCLPAAA